jgi:outer membrane murein-binding lipoprotein Lpp
MHKAQEKLIRWKDLYVSLANARDRLVQAESKKEAPSVVESLRAEVDRLHSDSEAALLEVQARMAKVKAERTSEGRSQSLDSEAEG